MPLTLAGKHRVLNQLAGNPATAAAITHVSLHTATPATDANEVSGGSYARQPVTWENPAGTETSGSLDATNQPSIPVPAGTSIEAVGFYTAVSGGTLIGYDDSGSVKETFTNAGTYKVTDVDIPVT